MNTTTPAPRNTKDRLAWIKPGASVSVIRYDSRNRVVSLEPGEIVRVLKRDVVIKLHDDNSESRDRFHRTEHVGYYANNNDDLPLLLPTARDSYSRRRTLLVPAGHPRIAAAYEERFEARRGALLRDAIIHAEKKAYSTTTAAGREEMITELEAAIATYRNTTR